MPNMSYCAFENTCHAVNQCLDLLEEEINEEYTITKNEWEYAQSLVKKLSKLERLVESLEDRRAQRNSPDGVMR